MKLGKFKKLTAALAVCAVMASALPVVPNMVSAASNIISNSTFDSGITGWSTYKESGGVCGKAPGGRMYRRCRAALIHHGIGGAFLLRLHVLRLDERHTWDFLHVGGQRPCGDGK